MKKYSYEFKLKVVEEYLTGKGGYKYLAERNKISNIADPDAIREKSKGRKPIMPKQKKIDNTEENKKYLKQLEDELLKLRIENAYLKELRRLRLEEETQNKKQELSATSEDYSGKKIFLQFYNFLKPHICIGKRDLIEKIQIKK